MTTYNGEKFLQKQLDSILKQSRLPDELVIVDDMSTDNTWELLEKYKRNNKTKTKIILKKNKENLGYNKNFIKCSNMCLGDIIIFSDQDDIWSTEKIEKFENIFLTRNKVISVISDIVLIDELDEPIKRPYYNSFKKNVKKKSFRDQVKDFYSSGMSLAIDNHYLKRYQQIIESNNLFFDTPLGLFSSLEDGLYHIKEPLTFHRIHRDNTSKPILNKMGSLKNGDRIIESRIARKEHLEACLLPNFKECISDDDKNILIFEINNLERSIFFINNTSLIHLISIFLNINKFSNLKLYLQLLLFYLNKKFNLIRGVKC